MIIQNFNRVEKKYVLNMDTYELIKKELKDRMKVDDFGKSLIYNIYFDTPNYEIINHSLEKPVYKEKLRLRSYGAFDSEKEAFLEIKKKFKGTVYKRRIPIRLKDFYSFFYNGIEPIFNNYTDKQIFNEIKYFMQNKTLTQQELLSYEREASFGIEDEAVRVTFDFNINYGDIEVLEKGDIGRRVLDENKVVMEVKNLNSIPIWFVKILSKYKVFPSSFSKYGEAYKKFIRKGKNEYCQ